MKIIKERRTAPPRQVEKKKTAQNTYRFRVPTRNK